MYLCLRDNIGNGMKPITADESRKLSDASREVRNTLIFLVIEDAIKEVAEGGEYQYSLPENGIYSNLDRYHITQYFTGLGYAVNTYEDGSLVIKWRT